MVIAPPFTVQFAFIVAPKLQPCGRSQVWTKLVLSTGRRNFEMAALWTVRMGTVGALTLLLPRLVAGTRVTRFSRLLRLPTHPVVSLQDPLKSVTRLLVAGAVPRRRRSSLASLVIRCPKLLPLLLIVGALQNASNRWPTLWQVPVEQEVLLFSRGRVLLLGTRLTLVRGLLALLLFAKLKLRKDRTPLRRPWPSTVRLQVPRPLVTTLLLVGRGTLVPKLFMSLIPMLLPLEGVNTRHTYLVKVRNTSGKITTPSCRRIRRGASLCPGPLLPPGPLLVRGMAALPLPPRILLTPWLVQGADIADRATVS